MCTLSASCSVGGHSVLSGRASVTFEPGTVHRLVSYRRSGNSSLPASKYTLIYCCSGEEQCVCVYVCVAVKAGQAVLFAQVALTPRNRVLSTVGANGLSYHCCWGGLVITLVMTLLYTHARAHTHTNLHKYTVL